MRYKRTKKILLFWCLFVGIGALYGSICMFIDPTGKLLHMDTLLPYFSVLQDGKNQALMQQNINVQQITVHLIRHQQHVIIQKDVIGLIELVMLLPLAVEQAIVQVLGVQLVVRYVINIIKHLVLVGGIKP